MNDTKILNDQELADYIQEIKDYLESLETEALNTGGDHPIQPPPKP